MRGGHTHRRDARAVGLYSALTVLLTYPLILDLPGRILGDGDAWQFTWNMWWVARALTSGVSPLSTDLIHHPVGADLSLHTMVWSATVPSIPLQLAVSRITLYNLLALASFVLAGWGMYRLARELGLSETAALASGLAFSFNPYHFCHALGHLNLLSYQWIPFLLTAAVRAHRSGWQFSGVASVAIWLAVIGWTDWYYFLFSLLGLGVLLVFAALRKDPAPKLLRAAAVLPVAILLLSPVLVPALRLAPRIDEPDVTARFAAPLESFLIPGPVSSWSAPFSGWHAVWTAGAAELGTFLSPSLLFVAILGWRKLPRTGRRLAAGWLALFFVLSLGPELQLFGKSSVGPLPFAWLRELVPGLEVMRAPIRFHLMTLAGLALLYGTGLQWLSTRFRERRLVAVLLTVFILENASIPMQTTAAEISPFWRELAAIPDKRALIDLHYLTQVLANQTHHGWKVAGRAGMVSREGPENIAFLQTEGLSQLLAENRILAAVNGRAERLAGPVAERLPARVRMVAMGRLPSGGRGRVRSAVPHQVWTAGGPQPRATETAFDAAAGDPLIIQLDVEGDELPGAPFRLEGDAGIEPYLPQVGPADGWTLLFYRLMPAREPTEQIPELLAGHGFRWVTLPYYGNSHFVEEVLGLAPAYQDRWLKAYRLPR